MACHFPYLVKSPFALSGLSHTPVPCGKCYDCKMRIVSQWAFRLRQEEKISLSSSFVTLTYDTSTVPISKKGWMSLDKTDLQKFFKRLRKHQGKHLDKTNIKYFAVGEYGTKKMRPHYHLIIFNTHADYIAKAWTSGDIHIGDVQDASIAYTLKYMLKESKIPLHKNDDRIKEFRLMSKHLGINYLTNATLKYHKENLLKNYITIDNKFKVPMPRYYRTKIWDPLEREKQNIAIIEVLNAIQKQREHEHNDPNYAGPVELDRASAEYRTVRAHKRATKRND